MKAVFALLFVSFLSFNASAASFIVTLTDKGETAKGMFMTKSKTIGEQTTVVYELVAASTEVQKVLEQESLKSRTCTLGIGLQASVISSVIEYDHENRTGNTETIRLLVRSIDGCAGVR